MPSLSEIKQNRQKKFIRKPYRIWDLTGEKNPFPSTQTKNTSSISLEKKTIETTNALPNTHEKGKNNQTTIRQQSDHRETTVSQQPPPHQTTIRQRSDSTQTTDRQPIRQQTDNPSDIDSTPTQTTKNNQPSPKEDSISIIKNLTGLQEKFFYVVLEYCSITEERQTGQLKTAKIASLIGCSYRCSKTTIERVTKKNIVTRLKGKSSISGFVQFEITEEIKKIGEGESLQKRNLCLDFNRFIIGIRQQIRQQSDNALDNGDNSSSSYIYKTTTTEDIPNADTSQLNLDWRNIDTEPLSKIGFSKNHLSQIASQNKLKPQVVQDSINVFAFDLQENNKAKGIKGDPINFFMGILRNGKPYAPPSNYESPQDKAMRLYREKMQAIEQRRADTEKEAINLAYNEWFSELTDAQKKDLLPENLRNNARLEKNKMLEGSARNYFETKIWPSVRDRIVGNKKRE
jgi:hypothetical protein